MNSTSSSSASAANFFGAPSFLDDAQMHHAIRCTLSDRVVTCGMSASFYVKWIIIGLVLGVGPIVAFMFSQGGLGKVMRDGPLIPRCILFLIVVLGWYLLIVRGLLSRRTITLDFLEGRVTFSKGMMAASERTESVADIRELKVFTEAGFGGRRSNQPPPMGHVVSLVMDDGREIKLLKTLDEAAMRNVVEGIATASRGALVPGMQANTGQTIEERADEAVPKGSAETGSVATPPRGWVTIAVIWVAFLGFMLTVINGADIGSSLMKRGWAKTEGRVLASRVWRDETPKDGAILAHPIIEGSMQATMKYEYEVNGKSYVGHEIARDASRRAAVANQYPAESTVPVFYNPANPGEAVLNAEVASGTMAWFAVGLAIIAGAVFWVRSVLRRSRGSV